MLKIYKITLFFKDGTMQQKKDFFGSFEEAEREAKIAFVNFEKIKAYEVEEVFK